MPLTRTLTRIINGQPVTVAAQCWFYQSGLSLPLPESVLRVDSTVITADNTLISSDVTLH